MAKKKTLDEFIAQARAVHGDKYDYSKVEYVRTQDPVDIICKEHGVFKQAPLSHIQGNGCPMCNHRSFKYTKEEFIEKSRKVHGDKYDYSKVEYINNISYVTIICPIHGEFKQTPQHHFKGFGCRKCSKTHNYTTQEFIEKCKEIWGDKYDYSNVEYKNQSTLVKIICPKHGEFESYPLHHMRGVGCPKCKNSKLENETKNILVTNGVEFIEKCNHKNFKWLGRQHLDFYLPELKIGIECQGIQHFLPLKVFGGEKGFKYRKTLDEQKSKLCNENNIKLFYVNYDDDIKNKVEEILKICQAKLY